MMCTPVLLFLIIAANCIHAEERPVVITGASGRTGSIIYGMLKQRGVDVRGFVRNATKAKEVLKCNKCDESEGIYVGDITNPASLVGVMDDASALVITTGAVPVCSRYDTPNWWDAPNCYFLPGNTPAEIDWLGGKNQVYAFGNGYQHESIPGRIFLVSEMGMTDPTAFLERLGTNATTGHVSFHKKSLEQLVMASGFQFTIVKPCHLQDIYGNTTGTGQKLVVGHYGSMQTSPPVIARKDVARVVVEALARPDISANLQFDLCVEDGPPTPDEEVPDLLKSARFPWQH